MNYEQEQKLKGIQADCAKGAATPYGMLNTSDQVEPCRASLRERVMMNLRRAERESNKALRLRELRDLLEKNPDVARILDLVEEVRG